MAGRKSNLKRFQIISAGDMSQSSITSAVTNIEFMDNIGIQLNWTGSPSGTFAIQVSLDYDQDNNGNVINAGNWVSVTLTPTPDTSVSPPIYIDMNQLSSPWIRVVYTKVSGTGTLNAFIAGKMV